MTQDNTAEQRDPSSFRDDRGFVFWRGDKVYRRINPGGESAYRALMDGGLYEALTSKGWMVRHVDADEGVIQPELIPVISYPYEWSFSQLRDAALLTLQVQQLALEKGMTMRDASAYNVQFMGGKPQLIDTLSFEPYKDGEPWVAYRQFCQHFLAPLALMSRVDVDLLQLLRVHIDGIPLGLAAKLLPIKDRLNFGLMTHLSLHAKFQTQHEGEAKKPRGSLSVTSQRGMLDNLERTVRGLKLPKLQTQWGDYYENTNYSDDGFKEKKRMVGEFLEREKPRRVLDLGSNDGSMSRIAADLGALVISCDIDPLAVERNYLQVRAAKETGLLPLLIDLTNPSPALGWANRERASFSDRAHADMALALALIHHLVIGANVPMGHVAEYFATLAPRLVIEFVPKADSQVKRLLASREDIFADYSPEGFEYAFGPHFRTVQKQAIAGTERILYLMERR